MSRSARQLRRARTRGRLAGVSIHATRGEAPYFLELRYHGKRSKRRGPYEDHQAAAVDAAELAQGIV